MSLDGYLHGWGMYIRTHTQMLHQSSTRIWLGPNLDHFNCSNFMACGIHNMEHILTGLLIVFCATSWNRLDWIGTD